MSIATLCVFRFGSTAARLWAFGQMQFARAPLRALPGIRFAKLFGSGTGEGFDPRPNFSVYAILGTWPSLTAAREQVAQAAVFQRYRDHATEHVTIEMAPVQSRGRWDGHAPFDRDGEAAPPAGAPIAVLTRATVRLRHLGGFWRRVPGISRTIPQQSALRFKIGLGEVPWLQQVTFSIWDDVGAMHRFAHEDGPHREAIRAVRAHDWFSEELYARFAVVGCEGTWAGRPLRPD